MPEFAFLADAAGAEFGTEALFSEVMGAGAGAGFGAELSALDLAGASNLGGLGGLLGGGVMSAGTGLGAGAIQGGLGSIFSAAAPEATMQIQNALSAAAPGANQIAASPAISPAQYGFLHNPYASVNNGTVSDAASLAPNEEILQPGEIDLVPNVQAGSAINTPYERALNPNLYGAMTGTPNPLPASMDSDRGGLSDLVGGVKDWWSGLKPSEKMLYGSAGLLGAQALFGKKQDTLKREHYNGPLSKFKYDPAYYTPYTPTPPTPYKPVYQKYAGGGPIEMMSNANAVGANTGYPMAEINKDAYATPYQTPISSNVLQGVSDTNVNPVTGEMLNFAHGGIADLGGYSDGGRMLKGPGDGMSDNIPATIANKQPARLANEEFVIPADVVSHLGNGSSEAGAKQLYKMMDRVRQARTGNKKQGKQIKPEKYMPR
jgi:hypothetical protein